MERCLLKLSTALLNISCKLVFFLARHIKSHLSFNGKLREELLNREIPTTLLETKVFIENWRKEYYEVRPLSSLRYRPSALEAK
jgi:hypothetical protein